MVDQRKFKKSVGPEQLEKLDRDLTFYPSRVTEPKVLSREQVEAFNRNGYIKGIQIFDEEEIGEQRRFFDDILAQTLAVGGSSYALSSAHIKYGKVYDTLTHPRIVACIRDLLGEEVIAWASQYFCKLPGDPRVVSWHQDASYWPLTPSRAITAWLAIDDADTENACMRFVSGSHHHGHLTYHLSEEAENNILNQTVEDVEQFGDPVDVELKAGQISIHSDLLLHSSGPNPSERRRCGLTLRYCTPDVRALGDFGWGGEGIVIGASDPEGHWGNPARPANDYAVSSETLTEALGIAARSK